MATKNVQQYVDGNLQVLPGPAIEDLRTYADGELEALLAALAADAVDTTGSFALGQQVSLSVSGPTGDTYEADVAAPIAKRPHGVVMAYQDRDGAPAVAKHELASFRDTDLGMSAVPFLGAAGDVIQLGIRQNDYPTGATTDTDGQHFLDRWAHGIGEHPAPTSITDLVPGLRIKITNAGLWQAWSDGTATRPCTVWLVAPETSGSEAIYTGVVQSDGVDVFVDVPHYFGQSSPSLVVGDYGVHVHGLTCADKAVVDLTTQLENGVGVYFTLAEYDVDAATTDRSTQQVAPTLQGLAWLNAFNPVPRSLAEALRAGCYIGDAEATRDWTDPSNVAVNTGVDPVTFTFDDQVLDAAAATYKHYFFAGDTGGLPPPPTSTLRILSQWYPGGEVATIAKSLATGSYVVAAVAKEMPTSAGEYGVALEIFPAATFGFVAADRQALQVYTFNFTTGTGAVASQAGVDLTQRRGVADGTLFGGGTDGGDYQAPAIAEQLGADYLWRLLLRKATGADYSVSAFLEALRAPAGISLLKLLPLAGTGDLTSEILGLQLGGASDYALEARESGGTRELRLKAGGAIRVYHRRTGGEGAGTSDLIEANDFHLGAQGKLVRRQCPIGVAWGDLDSAGNFGVRAVPRWDVLSVEDVSGAGNAGAPSVLTSQKIADGFSVGVGDVFVIKAAFRIADLDGDTLTALQISLHDGADNVIWDHAAGFFGIHAESNEDLAYVEIHVSAPTIGATGSARVTYHLETYDPATSSPNRSPFGQPGATRATRCTAQATVANFDWTADTLIRVLHQWSAGLGSQDVRLERLEVMRSRTDLWQPNGDDGLKLPQGHDREIRFELPVDVANDHQLHDVDVSCGVGTGGAGTCKLVLDLVEYDPATGAEASLLSGTVDKTDAVFGPPVTLTPAPADPALSASRRYVVVVKTVQTTAGGDFQIRDIEYRTRRHQIQ